MAIRYDQKKKDEVVAFIQKYNEENGRGGQSAAVKKWKLNPITVKSWLEKAGVATPGKTAKKKIPPGAIKLLGKRGAAASPASVSAALKRMVAIQEQMAALQSEYDSLKASL